MADISFIVSVVIMLYMYIEMQQKMMHLFVVKWLLGMAHLCFAMLTSSVVIITDSMCISASKCSDHAARKLRL